MQVQQADTPSSISKEQILKNQINCSQGNPCTLMCFNKKCNLNSFVCDIKNCKCNAGHKLCMKTQIKTIYDTLIQKSISLEPIQNKIEKLFDIAIDQLSDLRDKILQQFRDKFMLQGLNQKQLTMLKAIRSTQVKQITCAQSWEVIQKIYDTNQGIKSIEEIQNEIEQFSHQFNQKIKTFEFSLQKYLHKISSSTPTFLFLDSKIIKSKEDSNKIIAFFGKKVSSFTFLYRASDHKFQNSKFHEKCDNKTHTITLCQTQFDKIVGGYTAMKWNQKPSGSWAMDPQSASFLFSVTNNQKLIIGQKPNNNYQIHCRTDYGPTFGGGHDLHICDKANENKNSYANIPFSYINTKQIGVDPQAHKKFTGARNFRIKQWQVWKVQFQT